MRSLELFAGAGGLAMGVARAGFDHFAVIECDKFVCETFRENQSRHERDVEEWNLLELDAAKFDYKSVRVPIDLVSGGPPCQPFSAGGKHLGHKDQRDMFPEAIRAVRSLLPKAFIFENVKGLASRRYAEYFGYLYLQLSYPLIERKKGESWKSHRARLEQHHTGSRKPSTYKVLYQVLNAADYGVPQRRERIFLVGIRSDIGAHWSFPQPSHYHDHLLYDQWITGTYWDRHGVSRKARGTMPAQLSLRIAEIQKSVEEREQSKPWLTVRDAIGDLPEPCESRHGGIENHVRIAGARAYPGHSGSHIDLPAKTLKAGAHGVPGGENMLRYVNGKVRYFTVRESARLQTFPDDFVFLGSWGRVMRQLGNAVPVKLAYEIAKSVATAIQKA